MEGGSSNDGLGLIERAREYHHRDSLPPDEFEALMKLGGALVNPANYDDQCFIIGSYHPDEKPRLEYVQQVINEWSGRNHRAYLMEDFPDDLHPIVEFRLIADYSDHIIGVFEHDEGGFQFELGMFILIDKYRGRFSLLKRTYPTKDEEREKYNWMLSKGAFTLLDYHDDLWEWSDIDEFEAEVDDLLTELLG